MIRVHAISGPKEEIARELHKIGDRVLEAIVFVDEPQASAPLSDESMFDEMERFVVNVPDVDYSRESIYGRPATE
jgi:hypothetical protein